VGYGEKYPSYFWNSRNSKLKKNWTLLITLKNGRWGKPSKKEFSRQARQQSEA
jgi:hypothetical protein